jgi:hypothetical protein
MTAAIHPRGGPYWLVRPTYSLAVGKRPQQDSNLRTRLRRALLYTAATWQDVSCRPRLGAYRGRRRSGHAWP